MRIRSIESIAAVFGVSRPTIVEWQREGFPVAVRGGPGVPSEYESEACVNWLVDRELKKVQVETPRDKLFRLQSDEIELRLAKERAHLIPLSLLAPRLEAIVAAVSELWRHEPARLAARLEGTTRAERAELLRTAFDALLVEMSRLPTPPSAAGGSDKRPRSR